jgi:two-component system, OmpR family, phosphate regulon sensor histidine kinase PhoR
MKWKFNHVPILLAASMLALGGLVFFQYKWIAHSRKLSDEIFHQQVSMAVCSTIEKCGAKVTCTPEGCKVMCTASNDPQSSAIPANFLVNPNEPVNANLSSATSAPGNIDSDEFNNQLKRTLDFYNIDLPFQVSQSQYAPLSSTPAGAPTCVVNIPPKDDEAESFISLVFPSKNTYMVDQLKYMIAASFLILLFTAFVLLLANWWLLKQKQLMQRNTEMFNSMAHEFRTPLTNINLAAQLMSKKGNDPGNQKFLDIITKENSRLIQQVERVLHLARIDHGAHPLQQEQISLRALLDSVYHEMEIQIEEKNATVHFDSISDDVKIYGDRQHLTNVFRNLLDNALKYSTEKPEINISARDEKDGILISIQDNGIGIPASQSHLIFEKFQRLPQDQNAEQKGFGLGLAYVKKVIEMHKGFIQVDCTTQRGSCFNVFLPKFT